MKIRSLFLLLVFPLFLQAQKSLSIQDVSYNRLRPKMLSQLKWVPGSQTYAFVEDQKLYRGEAGNKPEIWVSLETLIQGTETKMRSFPRIHWLDEELIAFRAGDFFWKFDLAQEKASKMCALPEGASDLVISNSGRLAMVVDHNIFLSDGQGGEPQAITEDGSLDLLYGEAAHRSEFGITGGLFWSNDGEKLAFYRQDQSMVTDYPLIDYDALPAKLSPEKYPMAGGKSHEVTVGVYDPQTGQTTYLKTGKPAEQYLTNITWGPEDAFIYVAVVNRDQNHMWLRRYRADTGELDNTLFEEKHPKYVEPEHGPSFIPSGKGQFIWQSERDGWNHLYLYNGQGQLKKQLTSGDWEVTELLGYDEGGKTLYYVSTQASPLERKAYALKIKNGKSICLTPESGVHNIRLSSDKSQLIDAWSALDVPGRQVLRSTKDGELLDELNRAENPLAGYTVGDVRLDSLKAKDGTWLYTRTILPPGFNPDGTYPAMVYVYGGPHVQLIQNRWQGGASLFLQYMAARGLVVFTLDNRGSAGRGLGFEQETFRQLGTLEIEDQLVGVEHLKSLPYVDSTRLAVHGWSYGGFMTTSLMLRAPGTFKVGVAGGPVIDWKYYEVMYTERYMDTPEQNPEGYAQASLVNHVEKLQGRLLIVQGLQDNVVLPQHTDALVNKAIREGIQFDYFPYPRHAHHVGGQDRPHLYEKMAAYIVQYL